MFGDANSVGAQQCSKFIHANFTVLFAVVRQLVGGKCSFDYFLAFICKGVVSFFMGGEFMYPRSNLRHRFGWQGNKYPWNILGATVHGGTPFLNYQLACALLLISNGVAVENGI